MPHARKTDPHTSHEAAKSVTNLSPVKQTILHLLKTPMSDEMLIDLWRVFGEFNKWPMVSDSGIRSRRAELVLAGLVESAGLTKTRSGRNALIFKVKGN